jgi:hypothetical protein
VYQVGRLTRDPAEALQWFRRYTELEPDDAWGWLAVGEQELRLGKPVEARASMAKAAGLAPGADDIRERLQAARRAAAPTIEPVGGYQTDSDHNRTLRYGLAVDAALGDGVRLGGRLIRSAVGDGITDATLDEASLTLASRPRAAPRLDLQVGAARLASTAERVTPTGELRLRWRRGGTAAEVRALRQPLGSTPLLVANQAMRNEGRLGLEFPVGPVRLRGGGRAALIEAVGAETNLRLQGDVAVALPIGWRGEFSAQYHRLGYRDPATVGYFAPARVETVEGGTYWDIGGEGSVTAALDLGAGAQRLMEQGAAPGPWKLAARAWGWLAVALTGTIEWRTEAEAYSAPFAPEGTATSADWRFMSVATGVRFRLAR